MGVKAFLWMLLILSGAALVTRLLDLFMEDRKRSSGRTTMETLISVAVFMWSASVLMWGNV